MNRKKIEMRVASLANSRIQAGAYALILNEVDGERALPIIIGTSEAQAIALELRGIDPPRPLTYALFASVLDALGARLLRVLIYKAEQGIFYTYLYLSSGEMMLRVDSRTSDAVAIALRMKVPIYIYEDILNAACITQEADGLPTDPHRDRPTDEDEDSVQALEAALQKAIEKEDYEKAAQLRDLIKQRKTTYPPHT